MRTKTAVMSKDSSFWIWQTGLLIKVSGFICTVLCKINL